MARYGDIDKAINKLESNCVRCIDYLNCTHCHIDKVINELKSIPIADVAEVKHGYWVEWWDDNYLSYCHKCSECGSYPLTKEETMHDEVLSAYCPYCGAKMDGERSASE